MSDAADTRGMCQEKSGFLFSHTCEEVATKKCMRCQKGICRDHAHATDQGDVCTTCAKTELNQQREPGAPRQFNPATQGVYYSHNPYFYSGYYYPGYGYYGPGYWGHSYYHDSTHHYYHGGAGHAGTGHDPNDFTEGDAGAFNEERDSDFERGHGDS